MMERGFRGVGLDVGVMAVVADLVAAAGVEAASVMSVVSDLVAEGMLGRWGSAAGLVSMKDWYGYRWAVGSLKRWHRFSRRFCSFLN